MPQMDNTMPQQTTASFDGKEQTSSPLFEPGKHILTLLDNISDGVYAIDTQWCYTYVNKKGAELVNRAQEELIGKNMWELFPDAIALPFYKEAYQAVQEKKQTQFEAFYPPLNKWFEIHIYPSADGITILSQDITERKPPERERLELAQSAGHIGTFEWNIQTNVNIWSSELEALYGLPPGSFGGTYEGWAKWVHPDDLAQAEQAVQASLKTGDFTAEWRVVWPDASIHYIYARGKVFFDEQGMPLRMLGINMDVTRRKEAEEDLAKRTQEFQTLAENIPDIIARHDKNFRYIYVNPAIEITTGLPAHTFLGKTYREVGLPEEMCVFFDEQLTQVFQTGQPVSIEYSYTPPAEGERHYHSNLVPEYSEEGEVSSVLVITRNTTESKALEQRKDEFISMASHELRTPITTIKALTQLLRRKLEQQGLMEPALSLAKIETNINKLTRLVADLLDVSKIQAGKLEYAEQPVTIDELIRESVEIVQHTTTTHTILLDGTSHQNVSGDRDRLEQVFVNLIGNAIKYSPKAHTVEVSIATVKDEVKIQVRDYGVGIPEEHLDKIFDRFYRVSDKRNRSVSGLGMGLYIAYEIVKRHGGNISVESDEGKGSIFTVFLPIQGEASQGTSSESK